MPKKPKTWLTEHSTLSAFRTTRLSVDPKRYITDLSTKINSIGETTLELDSHTDTCVLGRDALIFLDYDRPVIVKGYDPAVSLLLNLEAARQGRSVLFSDEQKLLFKGRKKGFA